MQPGILVTLVHGTFASDAEWINLESALCRRLKGTFGENVVVQPFVWSPANNNIWARAAAANALASHLERLQEKYPSANQYVIAHSHGGNIALYARDLYFTQMRSKEKEATLAGIACLSTPFLHASVRNLGLLTDRNLLLGVCSFLLPLGYLLMFLCGVRDPFFVWFILSGFLSAVVSGFISGRANRFLSRHQIKPDVIRDALQACAPADFNSPLTKSAWV